jgi:hypothetical protein
LLQSIFKALIADDITRFAADSPPIRRRDWGQNDHELTAP